MSIVDPRDDLKPEREKIRRAAVAAIAFCALAFAGGWNVLPRYVDFPNDLLQRIAFVLQADTFVLLWVVVGVGMVARGRRHSAADIHAAVSGPPSPRIAVQVAFLQNTLEQAVLAIGAHLALATLTSGHVLALIVVAVVLFGIGRLTFLAGYRKGAHGRAFGMVTTIIPTLAAYALVVVLIVQTVLLD